MRISKFIKKLFIVFIALLIGNISLLADANQLKTIQHKQRVTHEKIKRLKVLEHLEKNKLYKNQQRLEQASNNLQQSKNQYSNLEAQLAQMEKDLTASIAEFNKANVDMRKRIRQVYKNQRTGMFQLILTAKDLNSLLDVVYFEKIVLKKDYAKIVAVRAKSQKIALMKKSIEAKKIALAQSIQQINSQQKNIKYAIAQNQSMINKYKTDRKTYERAERELARQSASIQSMIARNRGSSTVKVTSAGFMKPIGGRITSPFGWRTHPIFNSRTFHSGVDIAGPNRGSIRASNSGKVIYSGWYGGYGKVVILDHGVVNGRPTTTLYAHMSSIRVGQGQFVKKGEVVGYEGTTGYSTGPHVHFEVRINGKPNNPLNYI
ncbi:MAG TPA: peptidoglycan DD-metalloendopeptidase family protein [Candidatus Stercorousia faecigallinarum]|nr:peptidoglycan DD-metalloendopeptidase family protein [Candidatus Stercorousia faecigallinarum]